MKTLLQILMALVLAVSLCSCVFKEPIFSQGFIKVDPALGGVWASDGENGDPRKIEFAVCAPLDDERLVINHPAGEKGGGLYYEARALKIRDRNLLQLRVLATFSDGLPKADAERYTLVWLEKDGGDNAIRVRALGGDGVKDKTPAAVRNFLEDPAADWSKVFGEPAVFRKLKDN